MIKNQISLVHKVKVPKTLSQKTKSLAEIDSVDMLLICENIVVHFVIMQYHKKMFPNLEIIWRRKKYSENVVFCFLWGIIFVTILLTVLSSIELLSIIGFNVFGVINSEREGMFEPLILSIAWNMN